MKHYKVTVDHGGDMSNICTHPIQPTYTDSEAAHPRFRDYGLYRQKMAQQLVTGDSFARWLEQTERAEHGFATVFEVTRLDARLSPGWYKNVFGANNQLLRCDGPFKSEAEAVV